MSVSMLKYVGELEEFMVDYILGKPGLSHEHLKRCLELKTVLVKTWAGHTIVSLLLDGNDETSIRFCADGFSADYTRDALSGCRVRSIPTETGGSFIWKVIHLYDMPKLKETLELMVM